MRGCSLGHGNPRRSTGRKVRERKLAGASKRGDAWWKVGANYGISPLMCDSGRVSENGGRKMQREEGQLETPKSQGSAHTGKRIEAGESKKDYGSITRKKESQTLVKRVVGP